MTKVRYWKPLAFTCIIAASLGQLGLAESEIVQTARRRQAAQEYAARQSAIAAQRARNENANNQKTADAQQPQGQVDPLLQLAERAISKTSQRYLDADQHTPWQIMHGVVALRTDFELARGDAKISCIDFLSDAPQFRGEAWWQKTEHGGRAHPFSVPYAFEGHANQFLALLSMSNLPLTHEFKVDDETTVTMADMIQNAKMTVSSKEEITWTLWFLTHYIDIDSEWTNENGEAWSLEKLVRIQTQAEVNGAPCGGCHGLFAIAYARNAHLQRYGKLRGVYHQADQKLNRYIEMARSMQNNDGSFSSEFFKGPGQSRDFNERLKASGHMLEWLMMALPQSRLREAWVRKAVASVSTDLVHNASKPAECGPLYHSLNALIMYRDRVKPVMTPDDEPQELADATTPKPATEAPEPSAEVSTPQTQSVEDAHASEIPPALLSPKLHLAETPLDERQNASHSADDRSEAGKEQAPQTVRVTPQPAVSRPSPRSVLMAKKAAQRLAESVRENASAETMMTEEVSRPPLLRVPAKGTNRMAIKPSERTIR